MNRPGTSSTVTIATTLLLVACLPATALAARYRVSVVRDSAGIPHVRGHDFGSLGYGEGYAFAQDNLCTFADNVVTLRAQRSRYFGSQGLSISYASGVSDPNIKSDFFWQRIRDARVDLDLVNRRPPQGPTAELRALYRGWAAGYNAFLRSGKLRDPRCKGKPWVTPITERDLFLRVMQIATSASSSRLISGLVDAQPPGATAAAARRPDPAALRRMLGDASDSTLGSNGIALGSLATKDRDGMVLANPHRAWRGTERFWLAHLTVPGSYDVMGGTPFGFPPIGIGFNRHMAWTHTTSTSRRFVIYQLRLAPDDPTSYVVDGAREKMTTQTVTVGGQRHTFYSTRYGLVLDLPQAGYGWTSDTAYAVGDAELDDIRVGNEYLAMGRATSVRELLAVEQRHLGNPAFNTVAADDRGDALYADVGATPNVSQALIDDCIPQGAPQLVFTSARLITLDGSRTACAVPTARGTPVAGLLPPSQLPYLLRHDYVENSNDSYWLANPARPLVGFSPIVGLEGTLLGFRTRSGNTMIRERLARARFTIPALRALWQNDRNYAAELLAGQLAATCAASPAVAMPDGSTVDVGAACPVLERYGRTGNLDDAGAWLFGEWLRRAPSGAALFKDGLDPARPIDTPTELNTDNPAVLQALGAAVSNLTAHGVALDATPRQVQHATRASREIPIHGCFACFQAITASDDDPRAGGDPQFGAPYGEVISGSSMVLTTELTKRGPRSQGILTYSQATDPTSPWFANLTRLFSAKRWVPMRFLPSQLRADRAARPVRLPPR